MGSQEYLSLHNEGEHLYSLPLDLGSFVTATKMASMVDEAVLEDMTQLLHGPLSGPLPWATFRGNLALLEQLSQSPAWSRGMMFPVSLPTLQVDSEF